MNAPHAGTRRPPISLFRPWATLAPALLLVLLTAACGSSDTAAAQDPATPSTPESQPPAAAASATQATVTADPDTAPPDLLTFAAGAVPIRVGGPGADYGANFEHAVRIVDGDPYGFPFLNASPHDIVTEFDYALPAPTTFTRFAVPWIYETPSPGQTFTREVQVLGSASGPDSGYELLAQATLETHETRNEVTELAMVSTQPVQWVRLRLSGGIENLQEKMFYEFGEIIGNGTQEVPPLSDAFTGVWAVPGPDIELKQDGPLVTGCYDNNSELKGTLSGNILRATGVSPADIPSAFVLNVAPNGQLRGVRSTNGSPFRLMEGPLAPAGATTNCTQPEAPPGLGCGSIVHGIGFDFDSATIRSDAASILDMIYEGLQGDASASIIIEGHTSSEGADAYNAQLSERRAQSVVDALVTRGIPTTRLSAAGKGESEPIASNDDEAGRSINRRVEIDCS